MLAALDVVQALLGEAAACGGQLEGPQEVGGLLEGGARCVDLVDQVLDADDVVLAQHLRTTHACHISFCRLRSYQDTLEGIAALRAPE